MTKVVTALLGFWLIAVLGCPAATAQAPTLPHAFYGNIEIAGAAAPIDTQVEARGVGVVANISGNPRVTSEIGKYGGPSAFAPKLVVQGTVAAGTPIEFYVNGVRAECSVEGGAWQASVPFAAGTITQVHLRVGQAPSLPTPTPTATMSPTATRTPTATAAPSQPTATSTVGTPSRTDEPTEAPTATRSLSAPTLTPAAGPTLTLPAITSTATRSAVASASTPPPPVPTSLSVTPVRQASIERSPTPMASTSAPGERQPAQTMTVPAPTSTSTPVLLTATRIMPTARSTSRVILPSGTSAPGTLTDNQSTAAKSASSGLSVWPVLLLVASAVLVGGVLWSRRR
jgi:hypothetical protein